MRNMSFFMTTQQINDQTKTVTRRLGWYHLLAGDRVQAVVKGMGLKKGEKVQKLAKLRIKSVRTEPLNEITKADCIAEGFPEMEPADFVAMMVAKFKCAPDVMINRIEFEYIGE